MPSGVFAPASLGPITLRNRIIKAATFEGASPKGQVTDALVDYHVRVAAGGVGMSTVAYLAVAPEGRRSRPDRARRAGGQPEVQSVAGAGAVPPSEPHGHHRPGGY